MTQKTNESFLAKIPWKWFIVGILIELVFIPFFMFSRIWMTAASDYNQAGVSAGSISQDFTEDGYFMAMLLVGSTLISTLIGGKISSGNLSILYTFFHCSYTSLWITSITAQWTRYAANPNYAWSEGWAPFTLPPTEANIVGIGGIPNYGILIPAATYWTLLLILNNLMYIFMSAILRRQLIDVEDLPFPMTLPTIEMIKTVSESSTVSTSSGKKSIFKDKLLWYGFAAAWVIYIWDIVRVLSKGAVPRVPISWIGRWSTDYTAQVGFTFGLPWSASGLGIGLPSILFILIAFPIDILMTLLVWFIFWYSIFVPIVEINGLLPAQSPRGWGRVQVALTRTWDWPKLEYMTNGIIFGIALYTLFRGRDTFTRILRVFRGKKEFDDPVVSYRTSTIGYILCFVAIYGMILAVGSGWWWIVLLLTMQITYVGWFRIRGEFFWMGGPWETDRYIFQHLQAVTFQPFATPQTFTGLYTASTFAYSKGVRDISGQFWNKGIDAFKVQHDTGGSGKYTMISVIVATVIALVVGQAIYLGYAYSGLNSPLFNVRPGGPFVWQYQQNSPYEGAYERPFGPPMYPYVFGTVLAFVLMFVRARFAWFPLNPIGMATPLPLLFPPGPIVYWILLPVFVIKFLTLRLGGTKTMNMITKLGIGFLAGYFLKEIISFLVGIAVGIPNIPSP